MSKQPRFKKKGRSNDSFYLEQDTKAKPGIRHDGKRIKLPKIAWVRLAEPLPVTALGAEVLKHLKLLW